MGEAFGIYSKKRKKYYEDDTEDEDGETIEVSTGDVLDTDIGPVVVTAVDEDGDRLVLANSEDGTVVVDSQGLADMNPEKIDLTAEEVYAVVDGDDEDNDDDSEEDNPDE